MKLDPEELVEYAFAFVLFSAGICFLVGAAIFTIDAMLSLNP